VSLKTKWVTSILSLLTRFRSETHFGPAGRESDNNGIPSLPRMLLDSESPLSLPLAVLALDAAVVLHFMRACATTAAYASAASLAPLLAQGGAAWQRRWAVLPCEALVRREGLSVLYRNAPSPISSIFGCE